MKRCRNSRFPAVVIALAAVVWNWNPNFGWSGETGKPARLSAKTRKAWETAGFVSGWGRANRSNLMFRHGNEGAPGELPAFAITTPWKPGLIRGLPPPERPFALDLSFGVQSGEGLYEMTDKALAELLDLKNLHLLYAYVPNVTADGLKHIGQLAGLEALILLGGGMTDPGLKQLSKLKGLRSLEFIETDVSKADIGTLRQIQSLTFVTSVSDDGLKQLATLKELRDLRLHVAGLTDARMSRLTGFKWLRLLDISYNKLTDGGLKHLAALTNLESLGLSNTLITDKGLKELGRFDHLQALDLAFTDVTDDGLSHLVGLRKLRSLDLMRTGLTDEGLKHLGQIQSLEHLEVAATAVTADGLAALKKRLPKLKITVTELPNEFAFHWQPRRPGVSRSEIVKNFSKRAPHPDVITTKNLRGVRRFLGCGSAAIWHYGQKSARPAQIFGCGSAAIRQVRGSRCPKSLPFR